MKKYDDNLEKILTVVFGVLGTIAIIVNLFIKGWTTENLLDGLKDISGLVVVIIVFIIASKVFRAMSYSDFKGLFEKYLDDWVKQNRFLIDEEKRKEGKEEKEFYYMLTKKHHKNILFQEKLAKEFQVKASASDYNKGVFLYTDTKDKEEIIIGINKSLFLGNEYQDNLEEVARKLKERIIDFSENIDFIKKSNKVQFSDDDIKITENGKRIIISLKDIEKSNESARALINLLEYIKTMILALA